MPEFRNINDGLPTESMRYHCRVNGRKEILTLADLERYFGYYDDVLWLDESDMIKSRKQMVDGIKSFDDMQKVNYVEIARALNDIDRKKNPPPTVAGSVAILDYNRMKLSMEELEEKYQEEINALKRINSKLMIENESYKQEMVKEDSAQVKKLKIQNGILTGIIFRLKNPSPDPPSADIEYEQSDTPQEINQFSCNDDTLSKMQKESKRRHLKNTKK